jgi:hypothetical protein
MDFFSKLDNGRYAEFKTTYLNYLQMKSCSLPKDLNEMFTLASTHLKPKMALGGGIGSTFATTADKVDKKSGEDKGWRKPGGKNNCQITPGESKDERNGTAESEQSPKKKLKCFNCGEDHYINNCPEFMEFKRLKEEEKQATAI